LRSHTHSHERVVGGARRDPAAGGDIAEERSGFPGYTAIGGHQHLVDLASRLTGLQKAVHADDACLCRWPRRPLRPGRSRRSHRSRRTLRPGRSQRPRRSRGTGITFGTWPALAAIRDTNRYGNHGEEPHEAHRILTIVGSVSVPQIWLTRPMVPLPAFAHCRPLCPLPGCYRGYDPAPGCRAR
jgi:hypothetical protein